MGATLSSQVHRSRLLCSPEWLGGYDPVGGGSPPGGRHGSRRRQDERCRSGLAHIQSHVRRFILLLMSLLRTKGC